MMWQWNREVSLLANPIRICPHTKDSIRRIPKFIVGIPHLPPSSSGAGGPRRRGGPSPVLVVVVRVVRVLKVVLVVGGGGRRAHRGSLEQVGRGVGPHWLHRHVPCPAGSPWGHLERGGGPAAAAAAPVGGAGGSHAGGGAKLVDLEKTMSAKIKSWGGIGALLFSPARPPRPPPRRRPPPPGSS